MTEGVVNTVIAAVLLGGALGAALAGSLRDVARHEEYRAAWMLRFLRLVFILVCAIALGAAAIAGAVMAS